MTLAQAATESALTQMSTERVGHTATLLLDGTVLIAGGEGAGQSAELYLPDEDRFIEVGPMTASRAGHVAVLLRDGRVLLVGGGSVANPTAELFDPGTREFEATGATAKAYAPASPSRQPGPQATLLPDDRVLITGSEGRELYDPVSGAFAAISVGGGQGRKAASVLLADGRVETFGWGRAQDSEVFDPEALALTPGSVDATLSFDGQGNPNDYFCFATREDDDRVSVLTDAENACGGGLARSGRQRWIVGSSYGGDALTGYDSAWGALAGTIAEPRGWATTTTLPDGSLLLAGGGYVNSTGGSWETSRSAERFSYGVLHGSLGAITASAGPGPDRFHSNTLLPDGSVLLTGGGCPIQGVMVYGGSADKGSPCFETPTSDAVLVASRTGLEARGALRARRMRHQGLLLPSGRVLVAGGVTDPSDAPEELLDPATGSSTELEFRLQQRGSGILLPRGRALFAGPTGLELYDSASNQVEPVASLALECERPGLLLLEDGRVLIVGARALFEFHSKSKTASELVETGVHRCTDTPSQRITGEPLATLLPDGRMLIAGGGSNTIELYDRAARTISPILDTSGSFRGARLAEQRFFTWFNEVYLLGDFEVRRIDWRNRTADLYDLQSVDGMLDDPEVPTLGFSLTLMPDATLLLASSPKWRRLSLGRVPAAFEAACPGAEALPRDGGKAEDAAPYPAPARVRQGDEVELPTDFSVSCPEGSTGTASSSSANSPVPVWIPANGGRPVLGTFLRWSAEGALWRVPRTHWAGLGLLFYAVNGELHGLGPVEIEPLSELGDECTTGNACASGVCADGVCCDRDCEGTCEACTAAGKGSGIDGTCGEVELGAKCLPGHNCLPAAGGLLACTLTDEAKCVAEDASFYDAEIEQCAPFRCAMETGRCLHHCASNRDCTTGHACNADGQCGSALPAASVVITRTTGCGCETSDRGSPAWESALSGLATLLLLRRRRLSAIAAAARKRSSACSRRAGARGDQRVVE